MASKVVCLFAKGSKALEDYPKFHESLPQNSGRRQRKMTVDAEKAPEGLSVVKEGQAETGRALKARDFDSESHWQLSRQQARQVRAWTPRRNVPNHLALTTGLSIMRRAWLILQVITES